MACDLAVQVVNYRTRDHLGRCLESVLAALAQAGVPARVLVYDNASGDDLSELEHRFAARVEFVAGAENIGFGAGHNRLAARSDAGLICCVNPDIVVDRGNPFPALLDVFADPRVAAAGPRLVTPDGSTQRWDHGELRGLRARVANGAGHAHWRERAAAATVAWVSGAFLMVRREAFAAAGGFDEGFFLYKEEEDLCLRLRRGGGRILYVPAVAVTHVGGVVAGRDPELLRASTARFVAKHHPGPRRRVLDVLYRHVTRRI